MKLSQEEGAIRPEIALDKGIYEQFQLRRPDLWNEVFWPISSYLTNSSDEVDDNIVGLQSVDFLSLLERTNFPTLHLEEYFDEDYEDEIFFYVHAPIRTENQPLLEKLFQEIDSEETLRVRLLDALQEFESRSGNWASHRALLCLREIESKA